MKSKTTNWKIVPKESWKEIVAEYSDRIAAIRDLDPWNVTIPGNLTAGSRLAECVFSSSGDSQFVFVLRRICLFALNSGGVALQVSQTVADLWERGQFIVIPLNTRFILECWSRIHYGRQIAEKVLKGGDLANAVDKMERLTFGTKSEVHLPWGGVSSDRTSIHINDCLRSLADTEPKILDLYGFLSESSHPSFTENIYFQLAGPPVSNWDNKAYEATMRPMLEKCFRLLEQSANGTVEDMAYFIALSEAVSGVPEIENEKVP